MNRVIVGDCRDALRSLDAGSFACCVTSPPYYGLRDYGHPGQIGLEATPDLYVTSLLEVFREVRRVLRDDGTLWLNLGDSYASSIPGNARPDHSGPRLLGTRGGQRSAKAAQVASRRRFGVPLKNLLGMPWRVAFALQADGWFLRADLIWHKPNPMPESVDDRPTKAHEYVFLLSKSPRYHYDGAAIAERATCRSPANGPSGKHIEASKSDPKHRTKANLDKIGARSERNARSVWTITSEPYRGAHFATMPRALAQRCILAGSRPGDAVLDPFFGSGTVGEVCERTGRRWLGCDRRDSRSGDHAGGGSVSASAARG